MKFNKKFLKTTDLSLIVIIVIGILIVINFLSYQISYRWDLTQNKDYSISQTSKKTVNNLTDVVNIKAYFSTNLPVQFVNLRQEVGDVLDEYINYSGNKVKVEFIDPKKDEVIIRELYSLGIPQLQFNALENDKYQIINGYLGMVIKYGDKQEIIPMIQDTNNLEYQITSAIKKVTSEKLAVIGIWQGNDSLNTEKEINSAYKKLVELYEVQLINSENDQQIPVEVSTLIIIGPKEKFSDNQLKKIDSFVMRGGSLMILSGGVKIGQNLTAEKNDVGLNKLIESYGVKINNDLVSDIHSGFASFTQGFLNFTTNYPLWPKIIKSGFDQNNAAVAKLESIILPWTSSLTIFPEKVKDSKIFYLAKTTDQAVAQSENFVVNPQSELRANGKKAQYNLAVEIVGKFNSAFGQNNSSSSPSRLIVVGNSEFISDSFLRNNIDNLLFFQNLTDSLSLDENLINIRSKGIVNRPIKELSDNIKIVVRYVNVFGLTIIVMLFGLIRYFLRRRNRFIDEL